MEKEIRRLRNRIEQEIGIFFQAKLDEAANRRMPKEFNEVLENTREYILRGGKRLRPILFYYGYVAAGGEDKEDALRASVAMELLHAYFLVHDDIVDRDEVRHGGPSMHALYRQDYEERFAGKNVKHFGLAMAINAGDMTSEWSLEALLGTAFAPERKLEALRKLCRIAEETIVGQVLDEFTEMEDDIHEERIFAVQEYKTARYTIEGPLQTGAILAGAGEKELDFIASFSRPLGIAYQMQDDILGIFGNPSEIGKSVGTDLRAGKKTLLISYALKKASAESREYLSSRLGKRDLSEEEIEKMGDIIRETGSLRYSEEMIGQLTEDFKKRIQDGGAGIDARYAFLTGFADYLLGREA